MFFRSEHSCVRATNAVELYRFGSSWGLCAAGMVFALPVLYFKVRDTEYTEEDYVHVLPDTKVEEPS